MDLPIFSDNLKSSATWIAALDREQEVWQKALNESRARVEALIREHQVKEALRGAGPAIEEGRVLMVAESVSSWAREPDAKLNLERLLEIYRELVGASPAEDVLRKTEPAPLTAMHDPTPAILLPRMLDNACDWFGAPSFNELHAVEQAAVVYLRLLDLHPFPSHTATAALLAASFYTERAGFPPLIIMADEAARARYTNALEAAFRMLTQPLVEFFAEMLRQTMRLSAGIKNEE
jgi:hypothetical protein